MIKTIDRLFSLLSRISRADKDGYAYCICCSGKDHWANFDPAHYVGRSCFRLRWDLRNVWPCHRNCHEKEDHLTLYRASLIKVQGLQFVEELEFWGKEFCKQPNDKELAELRDHLERELQRFTYKDRPASPQV